MGFGRLSNINSGFGHINVIERTRAASGGPLFTASAPDVYSRLISAMCVDSYAYLNHPVTINGASKHSNGVAGGSAKNITFTEATVASGYGYHRKFPPM